MTVYIAGPIKGKKEYATDFVIAESMLWSNGNTVLNPAKLPKGLKDIQYMPICMQMVEQADAVYLLDGWERSLGAITEALYAARQGKKIFTISQNGKPKEFRWDHISHWFVEVNVNNEFAGT